MDEPLKFTTIIGEKSRTYIFPNAELVIENVTGICVRPSGTHRLIAQGGKFIVNTGWIAINIDADAWSL